MALVLSAASLIICGFSFVFFGVYLRRRTGPKRILAEFKEEVDKIILEIDSTTERDLTLVEDRIKALKTLLENADRRVADIERHIAVSVREQERHRTQEAAYAALGRQAGLAKAAEAGGGQGGSRVIPLSRNALRPGEEPGEKAPAPAETAGTGAFSPDAVSEPSPEPGVPPGISGTGAEGAPRTPLFVRAEREIAPAPSFMEQVAKLSREGFSADIIALRLGATVAEVELALAISGKP
jgi:hypothetical protein